MSTAPFDTESIRGRVLLVEDASVYRELQSLLLRRAGFAVVTCEQSHLALREAAQQPFDAVLLNSDAAGLDSAEFFSALRRHQPKIAIVYIAAALTVELTREMSRYGVAAVLQRPVNPGLLMETIDKVLGHGLRPGAPDFFSGSPEIRPRRADAAAPESATAVDASIAPFRPSSAPPFSTSTTASFSSFSEPSSPTASASPFVITLRR